MAEVKTIRALSRGLEVLECLEKKNSTSLNELHLTTKLSKATLLRILLTLENKGWVYRSLGDSNYRISVNSPMFGSVTGGENELIELAAPILHELSNLVGWPSDLAIRDDVNMKIIDSTRRQSPLSINKDVVGFCPHMLWSALGRAYLAFCPDDERMGILTALKDSKESFDQVSGDDNWVIHQLNDTRTRGYAVRETGYWGHIVDYPSNVDAIALPVISGAKVRCCISVAWVAGAITEQQIETTLFPALQSAAEEIANALKG